MDGLRALHARAGVHGGSAGRRSGSPFSGGAILGDRVRIRRMPAMRVYIRSMSARGRLGGLAAATQQAVHVLDAAGYGMIVIETVGVGQWNWISRARRIPCW